MADAVFDGLTVELPSDYKHAHAHRVRWSRNWARSYVVTDDFNLNSEAYKRYKLGKFMKPAKPSILLPSKCNFITREATWINSIEMQDWDWKNGVSLNVMWPNHTNCTPTS